MTDNQLKKNLSRGGAMYTPMRIAQIVITGALLIGSALAMVAERWIPGFLMLAASIVLSFLAIEE